MPSIEQLEKLLVNEPEDPFLLYAIAQEHARLRRYQDAIVWYDRTLSADPNYCYAFYHKAKAQESAGLIDDAAVTLRAGIVTAKSCRDQKALSELTAFLDELE